MARVLALSFAASLALSTVVAGCLGARQGRVAGETGDTVTLDADTAAPTDDAVVSGEDTATPGDTVPSDTEVGQDTATADTAVAGDTVISQTGCCLVPSDLPGGRAAPLEAAACAAACGEPAEPTVCADPPVCCYIADWQNDVYVVEESSCAANSGQVVDDAECPLYEDTVCCRWAGESPRIEVELEASVCARTGGYEVLGDYCWDQTALGTECCLMPSGERRLTSDYQCSPEGGERVGLTTCWKPPTEGTCCAFGCDGPRFFEDIDDCAAAGGDRVDGGRCAPPGAILP